MYRIIQYIRHHCQWMWGIIEKINAECFLLRYGWRLNLIETALSEYKIPIHFKRVEPSDIDRLCKFFERQPPDSYKYFQPHGFTRHDILKQYKNKAFMMFIALDHDALVGYFFLRCFANGKAFRGKIVDYKFRNRGIAKQMGSLSSRIAFTLGMRLFGTISKYNYASMQSSESVNKISIVKELPDDYLYIEYLPK